MKKAALYSLALHIAILLIFFVFPNFFASKIEITPPITVEIATISDLTQAPPAKSEKEPVKSQPKTKPIEKPESPKPIEKPLEPEKKPEPPKPVEKPVEKPIEPEKKPKEKPKEPEKPKEKPVEKPKDKPKEKPKKPDEDLDIDSVLKNLDKKKPVDKKPTEELDLDSVLKDLQKDKPSPEKPLKESKVISDKPVANVREGDQVSASERDAVSRQFVPCWNLLASAKGASDMVIEIKVQANPDGTIRDADIVDKARMSYDGAYSAAASSALRAVKNPKCSPLKLSPDKYDQWKNLTLRFNPKEMF